MSHAAPMLLALGSLLIVGSALAGGVISADDDSGQPAPAVRARLVRKYREHPHAMRVQFACLAAGCAADLASLACWLS